MSSRSLFTFLSAQPYSINFGLHTVLITSANTNHVSQMMLVLCTSFHLGDFG